MAELLRIIDLFFWVYMLMLLGRIISSWFPELREYTAVQFIGFCTDPYLNVFRSIIPPIGMMDISPIVAFFCLGFIEHAIKALVQMLFGY